MRPAVSRIPPSFFGSLLALPYVLACQWPVSATGAQGSAESTPAAREGEPRCSAALTAEASAALSGLPERPDNYCVDPHALIRAYGAGEAAPLALACERVLGPGCADDTRHGLTRVLALRYLHASDAASGVDVVLSRFDSAEGAYAHFTERLVGDLDPARLAARRLDVPGLAVLEGERVFSWRGRHTLWLRYVDEEREVGQSLAVAARELPHLAQQMLDVLPEEGGLPSAVERLPAAQRIDLGIRFMLVDALGVPGLGSSARGYYRDESKRWRVLSIVRSDSESAKDVLSTLSRHPSAKKIKGVDALQFIERRLPSEPHVGWVIGQRGSVIYGIGDEATALPEFMPAEREASVKLSLHEKLVKLTRINQR
jgi:hypothetical protein